MSDMVSTDDAERSPRVDGMATGYTGFPLHTVTKNEECNPGSERMEAKPHPVRGDPFVFGDADATSNREKPNEVKQYNREYQPQESPEKASYIFTRHASPPYLERIQSGILMHNVDLTFR